MDINKTHSNKTPHKSPRKVPISAIVIHDTASKTASSAINWFLHPDAKVSAHVVIDRDGTIYEMVSDDYVAWHAGASSLHGVANCNSYALGVELVDTDDDSGMQYTTEQMEACLAWCVNQCIRYDIPLNRIVGHDQICTPFGRKVDPGADFDWPKFLLSVASDILDSGKDPED